MSNQVELSEEAYQKFFQWLSPDPEQARAKYQTMRNRVVQCLQLFGCPGAEAEDLAETVLDRFILRIAAGHEIHNPAAYLKTSARNCYLEFLRKKQKEVSLEDLGEELFNPFVLFEDEEKVLKEEQLKCLDRCLTKLPDEKQKLIITYYFPESVPQPQAHQQLSHDFELTPGNLRVQAFRLRKKLLACLQECLKIPFPVK